MTYTYPSQRAVCNWCGCLVPAAATPTMLFSNSIGAVRVHTPFMPAAEDDLGWRRVGKRHAPDCEWVKCRAWQKKVVNDAV